MVLHFSFSDCQSFFFHFCSDFKLVCDQLPMESLLRIENTWREKVSGKVKENLKMREKVQKNEHEKTWAKVREKVQKKEHQKLRELLQQLSPREREVLELVVYQGLTLREAAEIMGVTLGSASSYIKRAKAAVKSQVERPPTQSPDFSATWTFSLEFVSRDSPAKK